MWENVSSSHMDSRVPAAAIDHQEATARFLVLIRKDLLNFPWKGEGISLPENDFVCAQPAVQRTPHHGNML